MDARLSASGPRPDPPAEKQRPRVKRYVPLDVYTWGEAFRVLAGWLTVPVLAVLTGIILYVYEMHLITVGDQDVRDLHFDQRIMNWANNHAHKFFINADICCNYDLQVFPGSTPSCMPGVSNIYWASWGGMQPHCPPTVTIRCPGSTTSTACWQVRRAVYPLLGMDPGTGRYANCTAAGRALIHVTTATTGSAVEVAGSFNGSDVTAPIVIPDPNNIDTAQLYAMVELLIQDLGYSDYVSPNERLSKAFALDGVTIPLYGPNLYRLNPLVLPLRRAANARTIQPWPSAIFNWPGVFVGRCPNTSVNEEWYLKGVATIQVPPYTYTNPTAMAMNLTFLQDSMRVSPWRLEVVQDGSEGEAAVTVSLQVLTAIKVFVGMVKEAGACLAWMLDESPWGTDMTYTEVYRGPFSALVAGGSYSGNFLQAVAVTVYDTSAPQRIAVPFYGGMWYIAACFLMAAVFVFSLGLLLLIVFPLVSWNVRNNHGLPPVVYRYMRKYRGW